MDKHKALLKRRYKAYNKMPKTMDVLRGSLVRVKRSCGKPNCRCQKGFKHQSLYLSQNYKGKTRMIYIPKHLEDKIRRYIKSYQKHKVILNQLSDINIKIFTKADR